MNRFDFETENFKFVQNKVCEFFPCHKIDDTDTFNCLFCYCPLYALGKDCGGHFTYTDKGVKNCTACNIPHRKENYDRIVDKIQLLIERVREKQKAEEQG